MLTLTAVSDVTVDLSPAAIPDPICSPQLSSVDSTAVGMVSAFLLQQQDRRRHHFEGYGPRTDTPRESWPDSAPSESEIATPPPCSLCKNLFRVDIHCAV